MKKKNIIQNKKFKKKIANNFKNERKKLQFYINKNIKFTKHQNLVNKLGIYTFYLTKRLIRRKKKEKKKFSNGTNFVLQKNSKRST